MANERWNPMKVTASPAAAAPTTWQARNVVWITAVPSA
jgi:hypothetical protein